MLAVRAVVPKRQSTGVNYAGPQLPKLPSPMARIGRYTIILGIFSFAIVLMASQVPHCHKSQIDTNKPNIITSVLQTLRLPTMTTNFLSVTRLDKIFSTPALAIVLPLVLGSGLGVGPSRKYASPRNVSLVSRKEEAEQILINRERRRV